MISPAAEEWRGRSWRALLFAGLLAIPGSIFLLWSAERLATEPRTRSGVSFEVIAGQAVSAKDGLRVTSVGVEGRAVLVAEMGGAKALDYPELQLDVEGLASASGAGVFFVRRQDPLSGHPRALTLAMVRQGKINMAEDPRWQGEIERIGLVVQGPIAGEVLIRSISLVPKTSRFSEVAERVVDNWRAFEDWGGGSVNYYIGADFAERRLTPVTSALAWLFCFVVLLQVGARAQLQVPPLPKVLVVGFLVAWAALDLRWQSDLVHRHLTPNSDDAIAADRQRAEFLQWARPQLAGARVFVVTADPTSYEAQRTRYHLGAIRTSFGMSRLPTDAEWQAGDYLLILDSVNSLVFDAAQGRVSAGGAAVPVRPVARASNVGVLFKITGARALP